MADTPASEIEEAIKTLETFAKIGPSQHATMRQFDVQTIVAAALTLRTAFSSLREDRERLDAIERGDVDVRRMGTTTVYHWVDDGDCRVESVLASSQEREPKSLRTAIDLVRAARGTR